MFDYLNCMINFPAITNSVYNNGVNKVTPTNASFVSFGAALKYDTAEFAITKALSKLSNFTKKEYLSLSPSEIKTLREAYNDLKIDSGRSFYDDMEKRHDYLSENLKNYCDKIFGKDKYVLIIIGRSVSSIGKVLGYKIGEDRVINIPMSFANHYLSDELLNKLKLNGSIDKFKEFLAGLGLTKDKIENSDKKYVILDFCATGKSLNGARNLLTRSDMLGKKHITVMNIGETISDYYKLLQMNLEFVCCKYKECAFVDGANTLEEIPFATRPYNYNKTSFKLFWFNLLDKQMQKKLNRISAPQNKMSFKDKLILKIRRMISVYKIRKTTSDTKVIHDWQKYMMKNNPPERNTHNW